MNCFQNCIFRCRWQRSNRNNTSTDSCELLSKLYFSLSLTAINYCWYNADMLWIAFKIVFFAVVDSSEWQHQKQNAVVNCFQNCIFRCRWQPLRSRPTLNRCCELLSKLYFSLSLTAVVLPRESWRCCELLSKLYFSLSLTAFDYDITNYSPLWIAFKIVFFAVVDSL